VVVDGVSTPPHGLLRLRMARSVPWMIESRDRSFVTEPGRACEWGVAFPVAVGILWAMQSGKPNTNQLRIIRLIEPKSRSTKVTHTHIHTYGGHGQKKICNWQG
jgi:hypothetical protein